MPETPGIGLKYFVNFKRSVVNLSDQTCDSGHRLADPESYLFTLLCGLIDKAKIGCLGSCALLDDYIYNATESVRNYMSTYHKAQHALETNDDSVFGLQDKLVESNYEAELSIKILSDLINKCGDGKPWAVPVRRRQSGFVVEVCASDDAVPEPGNPYIIPTLARGLD